MTRDTWMQSIGALATAAVVAAVLALLIGLLLTAGSTLNPGFLLEAPRAGGREGGILTLIVSTGLILLVCMSVVIPLGLGCAIYLSEIVAGHSRSARALGYSLDVLSGTPSIIFGLFGYQFFAITLGLGFSILSGGLTLACMALPLMVRSSEQSLRAVPPELRQAGAALALSRAGMLFHVLLPAARHGLTAGIILSIGRALAETAALLFTAGYVLRMPSSLLDSGRALSVHIYDMSMHVPGGQSRAAATAIVLISLIVIINLTVRRLLHSHTTGVVHAV